jgi:predicted secreted Zn-dependent protease
VREFQHYIADGAAYELRQLYTAPPVREPLTPDEALDAFCKTPGIRQHVQAFVAGVRFAERHHGITKGEQHDGS